MHNKKFNGPRKNDGPTSHHDTLRIEFPDTRRVLKEVLKGDRPQPPQTNFRQAAMLNVSRKLQSNPSRELKEPGDEEWGEICDTLPTDLKKSINSLRVLLQQRINLQSVLLPSQRARERVIQSTYDHITLESPVLAARFLTLFKDLWERAFPEGDIPFPEPRKSTE